MKQILLFFISMLFVGTCLADNTLYKVFHHRATSTQESIKQIMHMELGSVVLYFDQKPIINALPERADAKRENDLMQLIFFLPKTNINGSSCEKMIENLHNAKTHGYRVQLAQVSTPIPGIKVIITYNSAQVSFSYDQFESIGLQKGLIFRFYNRKLLHKLNKKGALLLRTVQLKKDRSLSSILDTVGMTVVREAILV